MRVSKIKVRRRLIELAEQSATGSGGNTRRLLDEHAPMASWRQTGRLAAELWAARRRSRS